MFPEAITYKGKTINKGTHRRVIISMKRRETGAVPGGGSVARNSLSEELTFQLRSKAQGSGHATHVGKSVPGGRNRKAEALREEGVGGALGRTAGPPVGGRGRRVATKGGGGHPTECGFCAKCNQQPRMSTGKESGTISFMFIKITNNKPTLCSRGDFQCPKAFCTLTSHKLHGPWELCVLSPTVQMREVKLPGRGTAHAGGEAGIKTHSSCFHLFSTNHTISEGSRELQNSAP